MITYFFLIHKWDPNRYYLSQRESSSNGNEGVLHISQNPRIGVSPTDGLESYIGRIAYLAWAVEYDTPPKRVS